MSSTARSASSSALLAGVEADEREAAERRAEKSVVREPLGEVDRGLRVLLRHLQPLAEAEDQAQLLVQPGALLDRRAGLLEGFALKRDHVREPVASRSRPAARAPARPGPGAARPSSLVGKDDCARPSAPLAR